MTDLQCRVSTKSKLVVLPFDARVRNVIPHSRIHAHELGNYLLVPHGHVETKLLRNLGYKLPGPIVNDYDWCGITPFSSQVETADLLTLSQRAYVLNSMGTGKTLASLFAADYLMQKGLVRSALVIAPLSTLTTVWEREVFRRMPHRSAVVLHGSRQKRLSALALERDFYIINHDGVSTIKNELLKMPFDVVIIDELAVLRNARTLRWKSIAAVVDGRKYAWGMTGSPTPNSPLDAWAQIRLLTPSNVTPYWKMFREQTMYQVTTFKWRAKRAAKDIVFTAMQPGVRFTLDQCADIPPTTYTDHDVTLSPQQEAAYAEMRRNMVTNFDPTVSITAVNAGVQVSKLLQICCGFAYDGNGIAHDLPMPERISVLKEIVESAAAKVIVFVPFKHAVRRVAEALRDEYSVEVMTGDTPKGERDRILTSFQHGLHPQVLVAHPKVTAHGHTLTAANVIVWFSPTTSAEVYEQANARIPRPGQKLHTHIVHLQSSKAEAKLYAALQGKLDLQAELLSLYKTLVNGDSNGKGKTR